MIPKFKKLTKAQKRDFLIYCRGMLSIKVGEAKKRTTDVKATSLAHWYFLWDTHGIIADYRDLKLCWRLVQAKEQLNLTIDLWIEDALHPNPCFYAQELYDHCQATMPPWVWSSYVNSFTKKSRGLYVPTYANPLKLGISPSGKAVVS